MHAVVVRVNVGDPESAQEELRTRVVPAVSQAPGFVAGYWTRKDNEGLSMTVWESEDAARQAAERITQNMPQTVELKDYEVREVIANA
jgi:heme-degrading monooxygenase HmoA